MQFGSNGESAIFDVIVAGAGASGATLAAGLVAAGFHVALVEAGPSQTGLVNQVPALAFLASINPATNWDFETEEIPALHQRRQRWSQGRMIGGSSGINGMLWMRGSRADYDLWEASGCAGWGWREALESYRHLEGSDREGALHGQTGPLKIRRAALELPLKAPFLNALQRAGFPLAEDINGDIEEGFGSFDVNIAGGLRCGVTRAFLAPLQGHPRLTVLSNTQAVSLLFAQGRVCGLLARQGQDEFNIICRHEVVLSCGALLTPHLLMRSGLGPADNLQAAGVAVRRNCPEVGRNLHNHPAVALRYHLSQPLSAARYLRPLAMVKAGLRYGANRSGPLGESYVALGGRFRSRAEDQGPADLIAVVMPALVKRAEVGAKLRDVFEYRHGFAVSVSLARQKSRGFVTLNPSNPQGAPCISPGYFSVPDDLTTLTRGLLRLRQALQSDPSLGPALREVAPLGGAHTPDALAEAIRAACGTFYHPGGTCRMGSDEAAPVDLRLRFRGVAGLRIADASVVPLPMGATMHAPSILIGARAARLIAEDLGRGSQIAGVL